MKEPVRNDGVLPTPPSRRQEIGDCSHGKQSFSHSWPKIELQMFDRVNPRSWVRNCQKYFEIYQVLESQKGEITFMYLEGRADIWFQGFFMSNSDKSARICGCTVSGV